MVVIDVVQEFEKEVQKQQKTSKDTGTQDETDDD
jgi:hypothetical protein